MRKAIPTLLATFLTVFGLVTLFLSTSIIFDLFGIRAKEGNYVLQVVLANFISAFCYLFGAYGILKGKKWTTSVLGFSALLLIASLIGLFIHINSGGIYESKTIGAMLFRISFTLAIAIFSYFTISKNQIK